MYITLKPGQLRVGDSLPTPDDLGPKVLGVDATVTDPTWGAMVPVRLAGLEAPRLITATSQIVAWRPDAA